MRNLRTFGAAAIVLLAMAMPSISAAQYPDERLDRFLNEHTRVKEKLERNPDLIYNKEFREQHPELREFLQNHPTVWGKLPGASRWGDYDEHHEWHEADWWHQHDPGWMYKHHPEWAENHPDWHGEHDGEYDEHHEWHDRDWWAANHPDWVEKHHPNWSQAHVEAHEEHHEDKVAHEEHKEAVHEAHVEHKEAVHEAHVKEKQEKQSH